LTGFQQTCNCTLSHTLLVHNYYFLTPQLCVPHLSVMCISPLITHIHLNVTPAAIAHSRRYLPLSLSMLTLT